MICSAVLRQFYVSWRIFVPNICPHCEPSIVSLAGMGWLKSYGYSVFLRYLNRMMQNHDFWMLCRGISFYFKCRGWHYRRPGLKIVTTVDFVSFTTECHCRNHRVWYSRCLFEFVKKHQVGTMSVNRFLLLHCPFEIDMLTQYMLLMSQTWVITV